MLPFRGGTERLTARMPAAGRAWQEPTAVGRALAWVTLLLQAAVVGGQCSGGMTVTRCPLYQIGGQPRLGTDAAACDHGAQVLTG
jgi:hypothetical protein